MAQTVRFVKAKVTASCGCRIIARIVESRMCTYLEVHLPVAGVAYLPQNLNLLSPDPIAYFEAEGERILFPGLFIVRQPIKQVMIAFSNQFKIHVTGKAMLGHRISFAVLPVGILPHTAYNGEKHRSVAFPVSRIRLPEIFLTVATDAT